MNKVELLAPAGDLNKLKTAIIYGADAVYISGKMYGMRVASKNLDENQLLEAVEFVHRRNKKIYITINIMPHNDDLRQLPDYIKYLISIGVDALIVSDPGVYRIVRSIDPDIEVHLSTQASVTNYETVKFWKEQGIKRIVLARELSLDEIHRIKIEVPDIELETFVHGAMCISYSGRCLLSNYMTGRDANRGNCAQACRWKYHLVEEKRPNEYFPIEENEQGTFIFNSKDLCMIQGIDDIIKSGTDSLKIEGRVKSQYYVATVVRAYRIAIDAYYEGNYDNKLGERLLTEIQKASHRDFTQGFFYKKPDGEDQVYGSSSYIRNYDFVGEILGYDVKTKIATMEQRNRIFPGDELEIFGPKDELINYRIEEFYDEEMNVLDVANKAQQIIKFKIDAPIEKYNLVRKKIHKKNPK